MATKSSENKTYKHTDRVTWRKVDKEAVILDLESSDYFSLNEVGVLVWEKIGSGEETDGIVEAVCAEYDVTESQARKDVAALLKELLKRKIIEERK